MLVALLMTGVSFYFQNFTSPQAQKSLRTLLISMKQQSPAVEIPEGVFYNIRTGMGVNQKVYAFDKANAKIIEVSA